jgi:hypothetical protein
VPSSSYGVDGFDGEDVEDRDGADFDGTLKKCDETDAASWDWGVLCLSASPAPRKVSFQLDRLLIFLRLGCVLSRTILNGLYTKFNTNQYQMLI